MTEPINRKTEARKRSDARGSADALIQEAIARAPFEQKLATNAAMPIVLDLMTESDCRMLWGLSGAHRRILPGVGFEFGSSYNFRYGWVSVGNFKARNVRVKGELRFTSPLPNPPNSPWMGVMLEESRLLCKQWALGAAQNEWRGRKDKANGGTDTTRM